jgi:hypothetical protein
MLVVVYCLIEVYIVSSCVSRCLTAASTCIHASVAEPLFEIIIKLFVDVAMWVWRRELV